MPSVKKVRSFSEIFAAKLFAAKRMFSPTRRLHSDGADEDDSFLNVSSSSTATCTPNKGLDRSDSNLKVAWRGRRAAANAFYLPIVNKRNLFSLSWNLENQLNDFQAKFANSFSHSSALRCAFFDTLASSFISGRWFSEAAVCQTHCIAIIGHELVAKGEIEVDWSNLNMINDSIADEENVFHTPVDSSQWADFTIENFTSKIEQTLQTLVLSERFEAVGPLCRMAISVYENTHNYKALIKIYAELQQACSRAEEIKTSGRRHLGSYFRVVFYGATHFGNEHKTEWIYRESRLTSLSEACDRMVESVKHALGHDHVEILPPKRDFDENKLKPDIAYVQITHVEPCYVNDSVSSKNRNNFELAAVKGAAAAFGLSAADDPMCYKLHTNVKTFVYEEHITDETTPHNAPERARLAVRRTILIVDKSFPNTRRRQCVVGRTELILSPLDVACDSIIVKAIQLRKILNAAGLTRGINEVEKSVLQRLDLKQLQLFLQGSISPTVNAGVLAYAEAFTAPAQLARYGNAGIAKLVSAFKVFMTECAEALRINEAAVGSDRSEYQLMLRNSFDKMLERLSNLFNGEKFVSTQYFNGVITSNNSGDHVKNSYENMLMMMQLNYRNRRQSIT